MILSMSSTSETLLCLQFANTAGFHALGDRADALADWPSLLAWAVDAGLMSRAEAAKLRGAAESHPDAPAAFGATIELRDAIQGVFSRIARHRPPSPDALATINERLSEALPNGRIVGAERGSYAWSWQKSDRLDRLLWPIVKSASDLLLSDDLTRLRECAGRDCSQLFVDESRNGSRRWCSMSGCGNRAKARRFYRKSAGK
jgi:predicted RNA-binding Zn ribbon-like protein